MSHFSISFTCNDIQSIEYSMRKINLQYSYAFISKYYQVQLLGCACKQPTGLPPGSGVKDIMIEPTRLCYMYVHLNYLFLCLFIMSLKRPIGVVVN